MRNLQPTGDRSVENCSDSIMGIPEAASRWNRQFETGATVGL